MNGTYFHVRKIGEHFETKGSPSCVLGHEIRRPDNKKPDGVYAGWS